jgi:hypothetical protein
VGGFLKVGNRLFLLKERIQVNEANEVEKLGEADRNSSSNSSLEASSRIL